MGRLEFDEEAEPEYEVLEDADLKYLCLLLTERFDYLMPLLLEGSSDSRAVYLEELKRIDDILIKLDPEAEYGPAFGFSFNF